ncbi:MAG: restriction endonuclease [Planctomycetes bacterium]|nr:restriction endonuclease [Planctomycetota bacterium]
MLRFIDNSGARGHSRDTIDDLVRVFEIRRWAEEERVRRETALAQNKPLLTQRERNRYAFEKRLQRQRSLEDLQKLDPSEFERFVADLFKAQGYNAEAVGGCADQGIDVRISLSDGSLWGVAQCKRYDNQNRVSASEIRDFGGAFMLSGAENGFFFTTGRLTRHAKRTAKGFRWLTTYNGPQLVDYIEKINKMLE